MNEIWKDIPGYEGLYQVSNLGRVKSFWLGKEQIMKSCKNSSGYLFVKLYKDGKKKHYKIHRLVASVFLPNPNNLLQVIHKDEDKTNNKVDNLEWCDCSYNVNYGTRNNKVAKANSKPILQFSLDGKFICKWDSATQVERETGIKQNCISPCLKGKRKTAGGYIWGYADDYEQIPFKIFDLEIYRKKVA